VSLSARLARTPILFQPITYRSVTARNRIVVSPMCQYSATDGLGDDWHVQHLGARAVGGAGIVFTEATHVSAIGRITPGCLGLWTEEHQAFMARLVRVIEMGGAVPAMQIAHAGRKASVAPPWHGSGPVAHEDGGWTPWGPSAIPFGEPNEVPHVMSAADIAAVVDQFAATARMAREAGIKILEVHGAHGYLLHSFLSPISNTRNDLYGGDLAGRSRALFEVIEAIRGEWPEELPLFVRLSCSDWMEGGLTIADSVELSKRLKALGTVDLIDCSSGGIAAKGPVIPSLYPGYQVKFSEAIREGAGIATGAVGLITSPEHADEILANGRADLVFIARAILADPTWPLQAAVSLGATPALPPQYQRTVIRAR
jgi:2,4-dienoyl-CoA reductase-like NADH-dependent reductase (Old Yellow Enzyme family)